MASAVAKDDDDDDDDGSSSLTSAATPTPPRRNPAPPARHHVTHEKVQLGMNACGVECCPHAAYKRLVAVASYLHVPGDDDDADGGGGMESRVGQLYLYNLNKKQPTREKRRGQLYLYNLAPTASKRDDEEEEARDDSRGGDGEAGEGKERADEATIDAGKAAMNAIEAAEKPWVRPSFDRGVRISASVVRHPPHDLPRHRISSRADESYPATRHPIKSNQQERWTEGWALVPAAAPLETRAIFETRWAPARYNTEKGPKLAVADAGGYLTLYQIDADHARDFPKYSLPYRGVAAREISKVRCGGGGLGMTTCVDWNPGDGSQDVAASSTSTSENPALAVVAADGSLRTIAVREDGALEVAATREKAHDLEAWAVAFASPAMALARPGQVIFTGGDDAAFKAWDVRANFGEKSAPLFSNKKTHGAGVTCVAPSPHDCHVVATGSYDDVVRLWDVRNASKALEIGHVNVGGGAWRLRWHPSQRKLAAAAMGGGVAIVEWTGRERVERKVDEATGEASLEYEISFGSVDKEPSYEAHGSIAYGADWGWRGDDGDGDDDDDDDDDDGSDGSSDLDSSRGTPSNELLKSPGGTFHRAGEATKTSVIVSCSFYDRGLHCWSPSVEDEIEPVVDGAANPTKLRRSVARAREDFDGGGGGGGGGGGREAAIDSDQEINSDGEHGV
jgi:diphthamide biosynthesis protein 7